MTDTGQTAPINLDRDAKIAVLKRLVLWYEKECRLEGADIEPEVTIIMSKLQRKMKQ